MRLWRELIFLLANVMGHWTTCLFPQPKLWPEKKKKQNIICLERKLFPKVILI